MAIVEKTEGNLVGQWDDVENKWVSPPQAIPVKPSSIKIDRNNVVLAFINENKVAELEAWINSSKLVEAYFASDNFIVDYTGLEILKGLIASAVAGSTLSSEMGTLLTEFFNRLQEGVENPNA